jgi:mannose-6-phosphate isomerase-like protein (cupin superfamily)
MCEMMQMSNREALDTLYSVDPQEIVKLPWEPVDGCAGVYQKILWRLGDYVEALVLYEPGASTVGKPHLAAHHHIWIVSGAATIGGRRLVENSYMHVPPGAWHGVTDVGPQGCTMLQMHRPHPPVEAESLAACD